MTKLENLERAILIFLIAALILGLTVSAVRKFHPPVRVTVEKFNAEGYKGSSGPSSSEEKININTAGADDLVKIKGIGAVTAGRIVQYRYENGSFSSIDELKSVKGVGVALFEKIRSRITVE